MHAIQPATDSRGRLRTVPAIVPDSDLDTEILLDFLKDREFGITFSHSEECRWVVQSVDGPQGPDGAFNVRVISAADHKGSIERWADADEKKVRVFVVWDGRFTIEPDYEDRFSRRDYSGSK